MISRGAHGSGAPLLKLLFILGDSAPQSIISASLKIWAWLQLGDTQHMGVVASIAPLVKILEITTDNPQVKGQLLALIGIGEERTILE